MAKQTKAEKIIELILSKGCKETRSKTKKYRQFIRPDKPGIYYFVGKNGALRSGRNISSSISLTSCIHLKQED